MKKVKIIVDVRSLSDKPSGIGYYTYNFLNTIIDKDFEVILVSDIIRSEELKELQRRGLKIINYNRRVRKSIEVIKYFKFIQKSINLVHPDVFWEPNNVIPTKLKNPYGKLVVTIHDIFPITHKKYYSMFYRLYYKIALKNTIEISDGLIYVSQETKKSVEDRYEKATTLKNFISYSIVKKIPRKWLKNSNNTDNNYFLFIGNVEKRKGVDILLKAFIKYKEEGGKKKLYLVGDLRDHAIMRILKRANMDVGKDIKYFGYVNNELKFKLLAGCSAFVFPSRAEGFGTPPIEALMFEKPCIVSNLSIFKEILGDSVDYFELADSEHKTVNNLKEKLKNYSKPDESKIKSILNRYSSNILSKKLSYFLKEELFS